MLNVLMRMYTCVFLRARTYICSNARMYVCHVILAHIRECRTRCPFGLRSHLCGAVHSKLPSDAKTQYIRRRTGRQTGGQTYAYLCMYICLYTSRSSSRSRSSSSSSSSSISSSSRTFVAWAFPATAAGCLGVPGNSSGSRISSSRSIRCLGVPSNSSGLSGCSRQQ